MSKEMLKRFSIEDVQMYREQGEDVDFSIVEIWGMAEGGNSHKNSISKEVLRKDADTFKGKFIVVDFDKYAKDAKTHTDSQSIVGYIDPREEIEFKTKVVEGISKEFVVVKALLSKVYSTEIVEMFRSDNERTVSCEFSCATKYGEDDYGNYLDDNDNIVKAEDNPILSYHIHGITILGRNYNPSIRGTEIKVKQFAEKIENPLKKFADERKSKLGKKEKYVSHSIDTSKESVDMGDWNGDKAKNDLLKEKNYEALGKKVCLGFKGGERKLENCKYPVMNLKNGKWVYNAEGLSSARAYGEQHDPSVADKAITLQKKLGLYKDDKDKEDTKKMSDVKEKEEVVMAKENETKVDDKEKEVEKKEMSAEEEKEMGCDKVMSDEDAKKDDEIEKDKEDIEKAKDDEKADEDDKKEEKSMSEQAKEFAESETDKEYIEKMFGQGLQGVVAEILELKKFQETRLELDKTNKLNSIMASVKGDLDEKQFSELQAEGVTKTFAELDSFENKVKAFAYEASKGKEKQDDGIMKFAGQGNVQTKAELTADDIFNKYL